MDDMRRDIELRLRGNLLRDWCRQLAEESDSVEFQDAWCSGHRIMRFCTVTADEVFEGLRGSGDYWGLGRFVLYEIHNDWDNPRLALSASLDGLKAAQKERARDLACSLPGDGPAPLDGSGGVYELAAWRLGPAGCSGNEILGSLDETWNTNVTFFEKSLRDWLAGERRIVWKVPDTEKRIVPVSDIAPELFIEGAQMTILTDRFERSREARERCLAIHGTACALCGFDFGREYGEQFAGKIEVHHKTPLNEIRSDYVVDPAKDLIPVCPNCHMILHSKPGGGAYSVEEVQAMLFNGRSGNESKTARGKK